MFITSTTANVKRAVSSRLDRRSSVGHPMLRSISTDFVCFAKFIPDVLWLLRICCHFPGCAPESIVLELYMIMNYRTPTIQ